MRFPWNSSFNLWHSQETEQIGYIHILIVKVVQNWYWTGCKLCSCDRSFVLLYTYYLPAGKKKSKGPQTLFPCSGIEYFQHLATKWPAAELTSFSFTSPSWRTSSLESDWLLCGLFPWWFSHRERSTLTLAASTSFPSFLASFVLIAFLQTCECETRTQEAELAAPSKFPWKMWTVSR